MVDSVALGLGAASLALLCVWVISFIIAHSVRPTTWNPVLNAVSEYGVLPHKTAPWIWVCWWTIAAVAFLLVGGLAHVFSVLAPPSGVTTNAVAGLVLLGIFGITRILTSIFPTDVRDNAPEDVKKPQIEDGVRHRSGHGLLHVLFAFVSFISITAASCLISAAFLNTVYSGVHLGQNASVLAGIGWAEVGAFVLMIFGSRIFVGYFGFLERIFYATHIAWLFAAASLLVQTAYDLQ